jgi:hypothetical protein
MTDWQVIALCAGLVVTHCAAAIYGVYVGCKAMDKAMDKAIEDIKNERLRG